MREFACDHPVNVIVRTSSGRVDVVAEDRESVAVDVTPGNNSEASRNAATQTRVEMSGNLLMIETPEARGFVVRRSPALNVRVHVPTDSRLQFNSTSAELRSVGRLGGVEISTISGNARLDHVAGDVKHNSASGDTHFNRVDGDLSTHTASGDMRGDTVGGGFTARTASGDLSINAIGGSVKAQSASGDIEVGSLSLGTARITSVSGDVELGVAEGTPVWLDLSSISGNTRSELPVSDAAPAGGATALNLHVRTVSGDIKVRRSRSAAVARPQPLAAGPPAA